MITQTDFNAACIRHGTDKGNPGHCFAHIYTPILNQIGQNARPNILEIGVQAGASLRAFSDLLPHARIWGLDITATPPFPDHPNVKTLNLDAANPDQLAAFRRHRSSWDLIVDDASHLPDHQETAWTHLFQDLNELGWYIIEDTQHQNLPRHHFVTRLLDYARALSLEPVGTQTATILFSGDIVAIQRLKAPCILDPTSVH